MLPEINMASDSRVFGMLARFESAADLVQAARKIHASGYKKFDCHSPFPIHGMDKAMGLGRSPLGYIIALCAFTGLGLMTYFTYWVSAVDYKFIISGKPYFSYQAYVPVLFAVAILTAALTAVFGMFHFNRLPRPHHPLFNSEQFSRVNDDAFFVSIEANDPKYDANSARSFLQSIGGKDIEIVHDDQ
jgi:hypothetical protein